MSLTWKRVSGILLLSGPILVGLYDLAAYLFGGNGSTFSLLLGDAGREHPMVIAGVGVLFGGLIVHFFGLRQTVTDDGTRSTE